MEYEIEVAGEGSVESTSDLKNWLSTERDLRWTKLEQHKSRAAAGELGPDLLPALTVALASPLLAELVKSIFAWLRARRSDKKVSIKVGSTELKFAIEDEKKILDVVAKLSK
jgi:hypothetical protein